MLRFNRLIIFFVSILLIISIGLYFFISSEKLKKLRGATTGPQFSYIIKYEIMSNRGRISKINALDTSINNNVYKPEIMLTIVDNNSSLEKASYLFDSQELENIMVLNQNGEKINFDNLNVGDIVEVSKENDIYQIKYL